MSRDFHELIKWSVDVQKIIIISKFLMRGSGEWGVRGEGEGMETSVFCFKYKHLASSGVIADNKGNHPSINFSVEKLLEIFK